MKLGERIKRACQQRRVTQPELAKALNVSSKSTVSRWWNCHNVPSPATVEAIARFLEVPIEFFNKDLSEAELLGMLNQERLKKGHGDSGTAVGERTIATGAILNARRVQRWAPLLSAPGFLALARGSMTVEDIQQTGQIEGYIPHDLDGNVVCVTTPGPLPEWGIPPRSQLFVRLDYGRAQEGDLCACPDGRGFCLKEIRRVNGLLSPGPDEVLGKVLGCYLEVRKGERQ